MTSARLTELKERHKNNVLTFAQGQEVFAEVERLNWILRQAYYGHQEDLMDEVNRQIQEGT